MRTKLTVSQNEKCECKHGTLCWRCRHLDCSWMRSLIPVPGWTATQHQLRFSTFGRIRVAASYSVERCPLFEPEGGTLCCTT